MSDIKGIILAAGEGKRLQHLTKDCPKCMVKLFGKSLLEHQIDAFRKCGINDITVIKGHKGEMINFSGIKYYENKDYKSTNMVETLFRGVSFIELGGDLIIGYGDIIYQIDNLNQVLSCKDEIGVMVDRNWRRYWELRFSDPLEDAETFVMDSEGYVIELGKKAKSFKRIHGQYTGLIKVRENKIKDFIDFYKSLNRNKVYDGKNFSNMYMTSFLQEIIDAGWKVKAVSVENGWLEIDSVNDLQIYENLYKVGELASFCRLEN